MEPEREAVAGAGALEEELRRAVDLAYKALASRDRTEAELRAFLERKRAEPDAIEAAIEELREAGYVDDARYAQRFAEDKRSIERWGRERIERDLLRRGVAAELVAPAVAAQDAGDERAAAVELLAERFRAGLPDDRERDRAWRLLVRRGYAPELAYEAVRAHARGE
ncbi:MAG: regulatory protein RecX [Thermoleophilaceae bacterium]